MFDEPALASALAEVGYRRLKRHIYRAEWSTEVEHLIHFQLYGTPKDFLAAEFGIRNKEAESFANRSIETYGGPLYSLHRSDPRTDFFLRFSLGRLAGSWGGRSSLTISAMSGSALARKVQNDIKQKLFPVIWEVTSLDRFLAILLTDTEPFRWLYSNAAMRAAVIVNLAQRLGTPVREIYPHLQPHFRDIANALHAGPDPDPASYIERLIRDAGS